MKNKLKSTLQNLVKGVIKDTSDQTFDAIKYWNKRAERYGRRSVLNLAHPVNEYHALTSKQKKILYPLLISQLDGSEERILDYGCGPGRFTSDLAEIINGKATGVDICHPLIKMAPSAPNTIYRTITCTELPSENEKYDIIWVCLVLGGVSKDSLKSVMNYLKYSLAPHGLLFLVENTSTRKDSVHWKYISVDQYKMMFPSIRLELIGKYMDCGEEISVMAGRNYEK